MIPIWRPLQGHRYHNLRKTFRKFCRLYPDLSKYHYCQKVFLNQCFMKSWFMNKKNNINFPILIYLYKSSVRSKRKAMRLKVCLVINPSTAAFSYLFVCTTLTRLWDFVKALREILYRTLKLDQFQIMRFQLKLVGSFFHCHYFWQLKNNSQTFHFLVNCFFHF